MESPVDDIVKSLVKSVKAIQMYSIRHPSAKNFYNPLYEKLSSFFKKHSVLELQIEQFTIQYAGNVVYEDKEKDTSIAFRLFRDGIRNISFLEGLAFEEMLTFIEIVSKVSKDTDLALCLWEGDFTHINFYVVEEEEELDYKIPEIRKLDID